jgi:uncharacterized protein (TIGR04255 family)
VTRIYRKPPLVEAICEFQFQSDKTWDWTIPGLVYQKIGKDFPEKTQEQSFQLRFAVQQSLLQSIDQPVQAPPQQFGGALTKMQFLTADRAAMVQVGPDLLAINVRTPYPSWKSFAKMIGEQFGIYVEIASPTKFKRIGLRYINRIDFGVTGLELTKYFSYYPHLPESIEQKHGLFAMRVVHPESNEQDALTVNLANVIQPGNLSYLFDLDYTLIQPDNVQLGKGLAWIDNAHSKIESLFEACITDELRDLFEVIK